MIQAKGLEPSIADRIGDYVTKSGGGLELVEQLLTDARLAPNASAKTALEQLRVLFRYLEIYNVLPYVSFDLSLARGLDYYTGVILEAVLIQNAASGASGHEVNVGSIAGGGRYDELVGMFASSSQHAIPCVGFSIGVERIFSILEAKLSQVSREKEKRKERDEKKKSEKRKMRNLLYEFSLYLSF